MFLISTCSAQFQIKLLVQYILPTVLFCLHVFSMYSWLLFSSDTESAHDEKTDKPEKKPVKISTFFSSLLKSNKADADVEMADNKVSD